MGVNPIPDNTPPYVRFESHTTHPLLFLFRIPSRRPLPPPSTTYPKLPLPYTFIGPIALPMPFL